MKIDILDLPFNKFIGLQLSSKPEYLLMLSENEHYLNHLSLIHASALFSLAEATSAYFLLTEFSTIENIIPVVRRVETKYQKPASGIIFSAAEYIDSDKLKVLDDLSQRGRALLSVRVTLFDLHSTLVMTSVFEWFVTQKASD